MVSRLHSIIRSHRPEHSTNDIGLRQTLSALKAGMMMMIRYLSLPSLPGRLYLFGALHLRCR